jgi:hypothetical protein
MTKVLKAGAVWLAIAVVVWLVTIWRWQSTGHDASTSDIVGQLFLLPVALAAALLLALWGSQRIRAQAAQPVVAPVVARSGGAHGAAGPAQAASPGAASAAQHDDALRQASAWVLAEALTLSVGQDASSALTTLRQRTARPELDAQLQDFDGMPVFTARVPELELSDWLDAHAELPRGSGQELSEAVLRSLALIEAPLHEMLSVISTLVPEPGTDGRNLDVGAGSAGHSEPLRAAHLSGVAEQVPKAVALSREARAPQLTIRLLLPAHWPSAERDMALNWVRARCGSLLDWAQLIQAKGLRWLTEPVEYPEAVWDEVDQHIVAWSRQARPELLLLLAADSAVSEVHIERMQSVGELFTSSHQTGKVPGEGAVALLIANDKWPDLARLDTPPLRLWRPAHTRRDKSADAAGRVGVSALSAAMTHAVGLNRANPDTLLLMADADHRASRTGELFEALQAVVPGVDPMLSVIRVGEACGELGLARALAPTALACAALRSPEVAGQVALAAHVQSSHERVVVALAPWSPEPASA